jgi:hypothetical protein
METKKYGPIAQRSRFNDRIALIADYASRLADLERGIIVGSWLRASAVCLANRSNRSVKGVKHSAVAPRRSFSTD